MNTETTTATLTPSELNKVNDLTNIAITHLIYGGGERGLRAILTACKVPAQRIVDVLKLKQSMAASKYDTRMVGVIASIIGRLQTPLYL